MLEVLVEVEAAIKRAENRLNNLNPMTEDVGEYDSGTAGKWRMSVRQTKAELEFLWAIKTPGPTLYAWVKHHATEKNEGIEASFDKFLLLGCGVSKFFLDHNRGHGWEIRYHTGGEASETLRCDR